MLSEYLIIFWIKERQDLQGWEMDWKYAWRVWKNNQLDGLANITSEFKYGLIQKKKMAFKPGNEGIKSLFEEGSFDRIVQG